MELEAIKKDSLSLVLRKNNISESQFFDIKYRVVRMINVAFVRAHGLKPGYGLNVVLCCFPDKPGFLIIDNRSTCYPTLRSSLPTFEQMFDRNNSLFWDMAHVGPHFSLRHTGKDTIFKDMVWGHEVHIVEPTRLGSMIRRKDPEYRDGYED